MTKETPLTIASILASIGVVIVGIVLSSAAFGQGNTTPWWHDPKYLLQIQTRSYEPSNFTELWQANQPKDAIEAQSDGEMKKFENSKMGLSFQIPSEWNLTSSEPQLCEDNACTLNFQRNLTGQSYPFLWYVEAYKLNGSDSMTFK